jgi:hypothetical protein
MLNNNELARNFYGILGYDAAYAMERMKENDCQSSRRDFVRSAFAAIEGWIWEYRQSIQSTIGSVRDLSPIEESAFAETSYTISDSGKLREQVRFVPMTVMLRFITRIAEEECCQQLIDFSSVDWTNFNQAIGIRNRITHPKVITDLMLSDADIAEVKAALLWLFGAVATGSEKLNLILVDHVQSMKEISDALSAGDSSMLKLYNMVVENPTK